MSLRAILCRGLLGMACASAAGAQALPPTAPTVPGSGTGAGPGFGPAPTGQIPPVSANVQMVPVKPVAPMKRPRVEYAGQSLQIEADNSSLNAILREVARVTGMKITGGVTDERVYGTYGPGTPSAVLDKLLEGTGANTLLILNSRQQPAELVLTQRNGGPTPPNPNLGRENDRDEDADTPPQLAHHTPAPGGNPAPPPPEAVQTPLPTQPVTPIAGVTAAATTEQSPNGVKTPQQIYEQLMKLQQQKQQPSPQ